jgi:hypothetical protein
MHRKFGNPAMIVAILALVFAIAGSAVASGLRKNSVTSKSIRKNSVTGSKVKNSSLTGSDIKDRSITGKDIDESTLAKVPTADSVDGIDGSSLIGRDTLVTFNVAMNRGDADRVLTTMGPFNLVGKCGVSGPTNFSAEVSQRTTVGGSWGNANGTTDSDWNPGEVDVVGAQGSVGPGARTLLGKWTSEMHDPASGLTVQGSVFFWAGFPGVNCRYTGSFVVTRP